MYARVRVRARTRAHTHTHTHTPMHFFSVFQMHTFVIVSAELINLHFFIYYIVLYNYITQTC